MNARFFLYQRATSILSSPSTEMILFWTLLVCGILILAFYLSRVEKHEINLDNSSGTYDKVADSALRRVNDNIVSGNAKARDFFTRGRIIQHNLTENQATEDIKNQIEADYRMALLMAEEDADIDTDRIIGNLLQFRPIGAITDAVENDANRKITDALAKTSDRTAAVARIIDETAIIHSDDQNSHDSSVTKGLSETMNIIMESVDDHDVKRSMSEIRAYIAKSGSADAELAVNAMDNSSIVYPHGLPEMDILTYTWERTSIPQNREKTRELREAFLTSLNDSVVNGNVVCASGRTARVLSSGLLIDHDPRVGAVSTVQAIRSELLRDIKTMYTEIINYDYQSDDAEKKSVAAYHLGLTKSEPDPVANEAMNDRLRKEVDRMVNGRTDLQDGDRNRIIMESYVYLGIDDD